MNILTHLLIFSFGCALLWISSGIAVKGVEKLSRSVKVSGFAASFLVLGILTSLGEISVGISSVVAKTPEVFVGNLIGASFTIIIFIIPVLALINRKIDLKRYLNTKRLLFFLVLVSLPALMAYDKQVTTTDGWILIVVYLLFFYLFYKEQNALKLFSLEHLSNKAVFRNVGKIVIGAGGIYLAATLLVNETIFFAELLRVPAFVVSLLVLAIGTNLPELAIAISSIVKKHTGIAFGNYIGSAAANVLIFGILTVVNGNFTISSLSYAFTLGIMLFGYGLFYLFARSKHTIHPYEALILMFVFAVFVIFQTLQLINASPVI